jgi:hypothetical protein
MREVVPEMSTEEILAFIRERDPALAGALEKDKPAPKVIEILVRNHPIARMP